MKQRTPEFEQAMATLEQSLIKAHPGGVPRNKIGEATGGILHPRTCANDDSNGNGIKGRFRVGGKIVYPVSGIITRIREKANTIN